MKAAQKSPKVTLHSSGSTTAIFDAFLLGTDARIPNEVADNSAV